MKNKVLVSAMLAGLLALSLAFVGCANGTPSGDSYYLKQWDVYAADFSAFNSFTFRSRGSGLTAFQNVGLNGDYAEVEDFWTDFENDSTFTRKLPLNGVGDGTGTEAEIRALIKSQITGIDAQLDQLFSLLKSRGNCVGSVDVSSETPSRYILLYFKKL